MTIAAGWDGRPGGFDALILARLLATVIGGDVLVVHIGAGEEPGRDLEDDLQQAFAGSEVAVRTERIAGDSPADALEDVAARPDVGLLAIGSTHQAGFGRVLPGAVGERLLGRVGSPLAIAPQGFAQSAPTVVGAEYLRVIAVGFDGSESSRVALALADQIALEAAAALRIIAIAQPLPYDVRGSPAAGPGSAPSTRDLQDRLTEAVASLSSDTRALPIFERGDPAGRVLQHADEGVDLLVIGSRSHSRAGAVLLGGTAKTILRRAPCPVIVTPPG